MIAKLLTPAESRLRFGKDHHYNPLEILEIAEKVNEIIEEINSRLTPHYEEPQPSIEEEAEMLDDEAAADVGLSDEQMGLPTESVVLEEPIKDPETIADLETIADREKEKDAADLTDNVKKDETIVTAKTNTAGTKAKANGQESKNKDKE